MSLKKAILSASSAARLNDLADRFDVTADRRRPSAVSRALMRSRRATSAQLLHALDVDEVRSACQEYEVPSVGDRRALIERLLETEASRESGGEVALLERGTFVALDLDPGRDSVCSVEAARVEGGRITDHVRHLVSPPRRPSPRAKRRRLLSAGALQAAKPLADVWTQVAPLLDGVAFIAAHDAAFVRSALRASHAEIELHVPFQCTRRLALRVWNLRAKTLDEVCAHLPFDDDTPVRGAEAVARIILRARAARAPASR